MYFFISFNEIPWNDFWDFIRSFIYGSFGGLAAISMSYINNESTSVSLRNTALMKFSPGISKKNAENESTSESNNLLLTENKDALKIIQESIDLIRRPSRIFLIKAAFVHIFIGGISGMIAVSAFNPNANELQTFSIAVIAGVSGFAFLKRSALIDSELTEKVLDVQKDAISYLIPNSEVLTLADQFLTSNYEFLDELNTLDEEIISTEVAAVSSNKKENEPLKQFDTDVPDSKEFEEYISQQMEDPEITNADINYLRELFYEQDYTLEEIQKMIREFEESDL